MTNTQQILKDLANAKAVFQLRAIQAAMGMDAVNCGKGEFAYEVEQAKNTATKEIMQ